MSSNPQQNLVQICRTRRLIYLLMAALLALVAILALIHPYSASTIIRELKGRWDVYLMYGSTAGKALWYPFFILVAFSSMNGFTKFIAGKQSLRGDLFFFLALLSVSLLFWHLAFDKLHDAITQMGLDFSIGDGPTVQLCQDGKYLNDFFAYGHVHSGKALVGAVLGDSARFITGEGFYAIHPFPVVLPFALIFLSLALFFYGLYRFCSADTISSLFYVSGYYMVFFSYFDGGAVDGFQGFAFLLFPILSGMKLPSWLSAEYLILVLFPFVVLCQFIFQYSHYYFYEIPFPGFYWGGAIRWMALAALARLMIILLFAGIRAYSYSRLTTVVFFIAALALYSQQIDRWFHMKFYSRAMVDEGEQLLMAFHSSKTVDFGEVLLKAKNYQLVLYTSDRQENKWDLCQRLMSDLEGLSYRSLMVSIYCEAHYLPKSQRPDRGILYRSLKDGDCDIECNPKLKELLRVEQRGAQKLIYGGPTNPRSLGLPFCLDNTVMVSSKMKRAY